MMLSGNLATRSPRPTNDESGVLALGRTLGVADHFRSLIAKHVQPDMTLETGAFTSSYKQHGYIGSYRAIFVIIDNPQAIEENLALVQNMRDADTEEGIAAFLDKRAHDWTQPS